MRHTNYCVHVRGEREEEEESEREGLPLGRKESCTSKGKMSDLMKVTDTKYECICHLRVDST